MTNRFKRYQCSNWKESMVKIESYKLPGIKDTTCSPSTSKTADQLSDDVMSIFVRKFGKYLRRSYNPSSPYNNFHKSDKVNADSNSYNCGRPGNFAADCNRPKKEDRPRDENRTDDRYMRDEKKEDRYKRDNNTDERTVDRSSDISKDRRMRTRGDKRPSHKNDRKVLVSEENNKNWADTDTDSSSNSSSSSDSEQEEVHCLMANQTSDDEDHLKLIPDGVMLPCLTSAEPTKIKFSSAIEIRGVEDGDWYKKNLPSIAPTNKGKKSLVEPDSIQGHPAREQFKLNCGDIDFLLLLRENVITEVNSLFHSFSMRTLNAMRTVKDIMAKVEKMLSWAETDSLETAFIADCSLLPNT
ncbi:glycine-rich RNA-binding protein [Dorcoceras hygrometricum]|uniref:Glycine-rich RNA-binding protein n=1 Tax=Dorcoceras hygrometricum TaxID=472368 RepID=A0A2Z7ATJ4_9LAMI|nr:glycine-rich RNA-binding protein [Dorcoceras hygrometricum]